MIIMNVHKVNIVRTLCRRLIVIYAGDVPCDFLCGRSPTKCNVKFTVHVFTMYFSCDGGN